MTLTPQGYRPRLVDATIDKLLTVFGAVSIDGPKWCGKTWTAENHCNSEIRITGSGRLQGNRELVMSNTDFALKGDVPHLIDEWQEVPRVWDAVREEVDRRNLKGQFILTGSSVPRRGEYTHSGTGRIESISMRTMTLYETGDSEGIVSLKDSISGPIDWTECKAVSLQDLADFIIRGGWPSSLDVDRDLYYMLPQSYVSHAVDDACGLDNRRLNKDKMSMLLKSLARNESSLASDSTIMRDMRKFDDDSVSKSTYYEYMDCLDRIHLIEDTPCFRPDVRSEMRVGKMPKRHLTDVSLAAAALGLDQEMLMDDPNTFGLFFEALCEHDLQIYAEANGFDFYHYRDARDREIDAVIETRDGRWAAIEIEPGVSRIDPAAESLLKYRDLFEREGKAPDALIVVSGMASAAYTRPDGVTVLPITAIRP